VKKVNMKLTFWTDKISLITTQSIRNQSNNWFYRNARNI